MARLRGGVLGVECSEERGEEVGDVRAVSLGVRANRVGELVLGEDAGVLGEEAEQQLGEEHVERVPSFCSF